MCLIVVLLPPSPSPPGKYVPCCSSLVFQCDRCWGVGWSQGCHGYCHDGLELWVAPAISRHLPPGWYTSQWVQFVLNPKWNPCVPLSHPIVGNVQQGRRPWQCGGGVWRSVHVQDAWLLQPDRPPAAALPPGWLLPSRQDVGECRAEQEGEHGWASTVIIERQYYYSRPWSDIMFQSIPTVGIPPFPRAYPGHLTPVPLHIGGHLMQDIPPQGAFDCGQNVQNSGVQN